MNSWNRVPSTLSVDLEQKRQNGPKLKPIAPPRFFSISTILKPSWRRSNKTSVEHDRNSELLTPTKPNLGFQSGQLQDFNELDLRENYLQTHQSYGLANPLTKSVAKRVNEEVRFIQNEEIKKRKSL